MGRIKDLSSMRFGYLIVVCATDKRDCDGNVVWKCKCDCGRFCEVSGRNLRRGCTKSCGCLHREQQLDLCKRYNQAKNIKNKRFGKLIALYPTEKRKNGSIVWKCKCDCGNYSFVSVSDLNSLHTQSCGFCSCSHGENLVRNYLDKLNIRYMQQHTFQDCKNPKTNAILRFDFYLPDYNCCIEYDGIQHYKDNDFFKSTVKENQYRDETKNLYCKNNNIDLIRISYKEDKRIFEIITNYVLGGGLIE